MHMNEKSRKDLVRENEMLRELAHLIVQRKKLNEKLEYHRAFPQEGFRQVTIRQLENKMEDIQSNIDNLAEILENRGLL